MWPQEGSGRFWNTRIKPWRLAHIIGINLSWVKLPWSCGTINAPRIQCWSKSVQLIKLACILKKFSCFLAFCVHIDCKITYRWYYCYISSNVKIRSFLDSFSSWKLINSIHEAIPVLSFLQHKPVSVTIQSPIKSYKILLSSSNLWSSAK